MRGSVARRTSRCPQILALARPLLTLLLPINLANQVHQVSAPRAPATLGTCLPWPFLLAAVLSVGIAVVLGVLAPIIGGSATDDAFRIMAIIGWFLAGIAGFILLGLHIGADNRRKAAGLYIENPTQTLLVRATLALGSIAVVITAVEIALWLSKTIGN